MTNILKAEFYKLWRTKSFWGIFCLSVVLSTVMMLDNKAPGTGMECFWSALYNIPLIYLLIIIFSALFVGCDFDSRVIDTFVSNGYSRYSILLAKCICYMTACVLILAAPLLLAVIVGSLLLGNVGQIEGLHLTAACVMILCAIGAMGILPFLCAFCFRDVGRTLAVPMVIFFLMIFLLNSDNAFQLALFLPIGQLRLASINAVSSYPTAIFIDIVWVVCGLFGTGLVFRQTDLK